MVADTAVYFSALVALWSFARAFKSPSTKRSQSPAIGSGSVHETLDWPQSPRVA